MFVKEIKRYVVSLIFQLFLKILRKFSKNSPKILVTVGRKRAEFSSLFSGRGEIFSENFSGCKGEIVCCKGKKRRDVHVLAFFDRWFMKMFLSWFERVECAFWFFFFHCWRQTVRTLRQIRNIYIRREFSSLFLVFSNFFRKFSENFSRCKGEIVVKEKRREGWSSRFLTRDDITYSRQDT